MSMKRPSKKPSLTNRPGHLIRRAQQIAVAIFMDECSAFDITPVQYAAMIAIKQNPGVDATRLSSLIAFDRSTLGDVLERLEARAVVLRKSSAHDKRVKVLQLTEAGEELLDAVESSVDRVQARILAPLKPDDRKQLLTLLEQLVEVNDGASRPTGDNAPPSKK